LAHNKKAADRRVALASILTAVVVVIVVFQTINVVDYHDPMAPSFFPLLLAYLLFACGLFLAIRTWSSHAAELQDHDDEAPRPRFGRGVLGALALVLYGFGVFYIGFWLASFLAVLGLGWLLLDRDATRRFMGLMLVMGIVLPWVVALMFDVFAGVKMPLGWGGG